MKKNIHPEYVDAEVICLCGNKTTVKSSSSNTIKVELCYNCHPFYTGEQKIVDTANRVKKFNEQSKVAQKMQTHIQAKKEKINSKNKKDNLIKEKPILTLRDMMDALKK